MTVKTLKDIQNLFYKELQLLYPKEEIRNFVYLILNFKAGFSKTDILIKDQDPIEEEILNFILQCLNRLKTNEPIQYIIGHTEFYNLPFYVNPSVLIPRPETEELVQWIIEDTKNKSITLLDIGTGSGCIPIALKKNIPEASVSAWDISVDALDTAKKNAVLNKVEINFLHQNTLTPPNEQNKYDVIVSNPPYIREEEMLMMHKNVLQFEPHLALFVSNNDPLIFYRAISLFAKNALKNNGKLYFEINEAFGKKTCELLKELNFRDIELRNDLFGKSRMIRAKKVECLKSS